MHAAPIHFEHEIPLFPLPNCVLFPGVVQPLRIFEPRYRRMIADAMGQTGQSAMAMALLKPGWEKEYYSKPAIYPVLCVGRVIAHEKLSDGNYNLLLQGVSRARVKTEKLFAGDWGAYRIAYLEPLSDAAPNAGTSETLCRQVLRKLFETTALRDLTVTPALRDLFEDHSPFPRLLDALAFSLVQDVQTKQRILETLDTASRAELLLREIIALAGRLGPAPVADWPPPPEMN